MDFKQLEYFKTIYEEGSISRAAERLYISQQGLSKAILALEKELDCRLFERNPKGVVLTKAGKALLARIENILEERDAVLREMKKFREHEKLSIHMVIGSRFSFPKNFFKNFVSQYPEIEFEMKELEDEACLYNIEHGKTELAVVISPKRKEGYECQLIKKEKLSLVLPKDHPLAAKKQIVLSDLEGMEIVYHSGSSWDVVMDQCDKRRIHFAKTIEVPGMVALYQSCSIMETPGISLGSLEGKMAFPNLIEIPISEEEVAWNVTLMYHESMKNVKPIKKFLTYLNERLEEETTW